MSRAGLFTRDLGLGKTVPGGVLKKHTWTSREAQIPHVPFLSNLQPWKALRAQPLALGMVSVSQKPGGSPLLALTLLQHSSSITWDPMVDEIWFWLFGGPAQLLLLCREGGGVASASERADPKMSPSDPCPAIYILV